ncbi:MAG: FadR/GntR family transcriptional regulator [Silicimonas sp.]
MTEQKSRRGHMVTDLVETLRTRIAQGEFNPGDRLPSEALLSETYGVSRTVIREAIASLRADGLVEPRQGSGVYVLEGKQSDVAPFQNVDFARVSSVVELLELRTAVESEAAALAAIRRSPTQEEQILECLQAFMEASQSERSTSQEDFALHLAIADASNNPRFGEFLRLLGVNVIPRRALRPEGSDHKINTGYLSGIADEHQMIVDAILDGDAERARQRMRDHLEGSLSRYRRLLRSASAAPPESAQAAT